MLSFGELLDMFPDGVAYNYGFRWCTRQRSVVWCLITLSALSVRFYYKCFREVSKGDVLLKPKLFAVYILSYVQWCLDGRCSDIGLLAPEKRKGSCLVIYWFV
ncbi:hypothetical protein RHMOL_Rhmol09G0250400 [Rhododendron molle]|uniref:Uncharacterized protein n=1 Tax=Rhododendron molle TaxID=49168 RepID=A0ACC0MH21_RHOML|nr:hypothetical protein RHMOL_Rhmol09G0250400 [Rhododendron molle]